MPEDEQPWLHELEICVHGNITALSDHLGDMGAPGTGVFVDDRRVLSRLVVSVGEGRSVPVASGSEGEQTEVLCLVRGLGDAGPDATLELLRRRRLVDTGMEEALTLRSRAAHRVTTTVRIDVAGDGAEVAAVKAGRPPARTLPVSHEQNGVAGRLTWGDERHTTIVGADDAVPSQEDEGGSFTWQVGLDPGTEATLELRLETRRVGAPTFAPEFGGRSVDFSGVTVRSDDPRLAPLVSRSLADLRGLLMSDPEQPTDVFAAAGTPWYLTLFGRDSIWAARFMVPFGTDLARGTLLALARRQGTVTDAERVEEPGKIVHEVRRATYADPVSGLTLPPHYYGSVDATALWIRLLHDAWMWGLADDTVRALRPHLDAALGWLEARAVAGGGLLRQDRVDGHGLANQGWKDSTDSMRRRDGSIAPGPVAVVEAQAYAVAAARGAAHLLESVCDEDGSRWREWSDRLSDSVRDHYWVDADVRHLAMAVDADGLLVDGVGSNMGHVLGTGTLTPAEARRTAFVLSRPDLLGAAGLRTLSRDNPAYNPVGYHTGSVWTHDNAITALGLAQEGFPAEAARVLGALVEVGSWTGNRWPELFGGELLMGRPLPYPASCRPQAWAAASAGALVEVLLGLGADAPRGSLRLAPIAPAPFGAMTVSGLRVGETQVRVEVNAEGEVVDVDAPGLDVVVGAVT